MELILFILTGISIAFAAYCHSMWGEALEFSKRLNAIHREQRINQAKMVVDTLEKHNVSNEVINLFKFDYQLKCMSDEEVGVLTEYLHESCKSL